MISTGKAIRLNRIFRTPSSKALVVAYDHAQMLGPIAGTEKPVPVIRRLAEARVDAILLSLGAIQNSAEAFLVPDAPAIIARLDWTNAWYRKDAAATGAYASCLVGQVEDAVRCGADAVLTYMFMGSGDPGHEAREIARNAEVSRAAERCGVPHIIESMARGKDVADPGDVGWVKLHTRIASELGADLIKTDYPGDAAGLRAVVEACPTPVLVAGGPKAGGDEQALAMVEAVAEAGAAGVIFGRYVIQAEDMESFLAGARKRLSTAGTHRGE